MENSNIYHNNEVVVFEIILMLTEKNIVVNVMVVAQGTNDMTRDSFGRNDWNFVIDFENY